MKPPDGVLIVLLVLRLPTDAGQRRKDKVVGKAVCVTAGRKKQSDQIRRGGDKRQHPPGHRQEVIKDQHRALPDEKHGAFVKRVRVFPECFLLFGRDLIKRINILVDRRRR